MNTPQIGDDVHYFEPNDVTLKPRAATVTDVHGAVRVDLNYHVGGAGGGSLRPVIGTEYNADPKAGCWRWMPQPA